MPNLETEINMFTAIENLKLLVSVVYHTHVHIKQTKQTKQSDGSWCNKRLKMTANSKLTQILSSAMSWEYYFEIILQ